MTTHTTPAGTATGRLTSTPMYRSLLVAIATAVIVLTSWTGAQASAIAAATDGNGPAHPSLRQLERVGGSDGAQHPSIRQLERAAEADVTGPTADDLVRLEHNELRRFRNRAPADALAALDAEIARLRAALD